MSAKNIEIYLPDGAYCFLVDEKILIFEGPSLTEIEVGEDAPILVASHDDLVFVGFESKTLICYSGGKEVSRVPKLPKKPAACFVDEEKEALIISDRYGDVNAFKLNDLSAGTAFLFGHCAVGVSTLLRHGPLVISGDLGGKIRVSEYPNIFNIVSFCCEGSSEVLCLSVPPLLGMLVSGKRNGALQLWNFTAGSLLASHSFVDEAHSRERPVLSVSPTSAGDRLLVVHGSAAAPLRASLVEVVRSLSAVSAGEYSFRVLCSLPLAAGGQGSVAVQRQRGEGDLYVVSAPFTGSVEAVRVDNEAGEVSGADLPPELAALAARLERAKPAGERPPQK